MRGPGRRSTTRDAPATKLSGRSRQRVRVATSWMSKRPFGATHEVSRGTMSEMGR